MPIRYHIIISRHIDGKPVNNQLPEHEVDAYFSSKLQMLAFLNWYSETYAKNLEYCDTVMKREYWEDYVSPEEKKK